MPGAAIQTIGPLSRFEDGVSASCGSRKFPIPLIATTFDCVITGGLAVVRTARRFRNGEDQSIEATVTFPVPADAVLTGLVAVIDGRRLVAVAAPREGARRDYEEALDEGRTAILHEEALKGIHMLSIGHLPPGQEVEVVSTFTTALSHAGPNPSLRIPVTVGDIYGRSPLIASDDLVTDRGIRHEATLTVSLDGGEARLIGHGVLNGPVTVVMDAALDLAFTGQRLPIARGRAADGREVTITATRAAAGDLPLSTALLIDRSGSTGAPIEADAQLSILQAVHRGLAACFETALRDGDDIALWQFDSGAERIGRARTRQGWLALQGGLTEPQGGTELGTALSQVLEMDKIRDVLVVTDGQTWAHQVDDLVRKGARITAVLVGAAALDGNIGDLCSQTGGQVFVVAGQDVAGALAAAIASLRVPASPVTPGEAMALPEFMRAVRAGTALTVQWAGSTSAVASDDIGRYAAALALPSLSRTAAVDVSVAHGLVNHLTSLLIVDEVGAKQDGIPVTRKVPLMAPSNVQACLRPSAHMARLAFDAPHLRSGEPQAAVGRSTDAAKRPRQQVPLLEKLAGLLRTDLKTIAARIDWDGVANALVSGDISGLAPSDRRKLQGITNAELEHLASALGLSTIMTLVGLMARYAGANNRAAERVAHRILGKGHDELVARAIAGLGLILDA